MTQEIKAAAERVRAIRSKGELLFSKRQELIREVYKDFALPMEKYLEDHFHLADAYLAEQQAEDGEAVTEEWLRSLGFENNCWGIPVYPGTALAYHDGFLGATHRTEVYELSATPPTRGQVRQMLKAIGILTRLTS